MNKFLAVYPAFFKSLIFGKSNLKFLIGVILGFSFSIAVILSTLGLMDGFEKILRTSLKGQEGDISIHSRNGFFSESSLRDDLLNAGIDSASFVVMTEGFAIAESDSKAVLILGVDNEEFSRLTGNMTLLKANEIIVGKVLAQDLQINIGSDLTIAFAEGNKEFSGLPSLRHFTVKEIREHPLYQKDQRLILMRKDGLQAFLNANGLVNLTMIKVPLEYTLLNLHVDESKRIVNYLTKLDETLDFSYISRPYWHEFKTLIDAVQAEKVMIGVILQVIVVMAILNVVAFVIFINEKKSKELFLLKALGLSASALSKGWYIFIIFLWISSCISSIIMVKIFDWLLQNSSFLKLPGDVYQLEKISLSLSAQSYFIVFSLALIWLIILGFFMLRKMKAKAILQGLRQEFG